MFAIVATGGKQYRVHDGDVFDVERLDGDVGDTLDLTSVLMISDKKIQTGLDVPDNARVSVEIVAQRRADKILVFKKKRRKKYRRTHGHRQALTRLRVLSVKSS